jgi:hypothetical protein
MRLLNLWDKARYDTSTDRAFFHNLDAIGAHPGVEELRYLGMGWPGWDEGLTTLQNITNCYQDKPLPDMIITYAYKRKEDYPGLRDVLIPKCMRWNESNYEFFLYTLLSRDIGLCIFHHQNDTFSWGAKRIRGIKFENIPHCAEPEIFKDYREDKIYDILISGFMREDVYPFRHRLRKIVVERLSSRYNCKILPHPGYRSRYALKPNTCILEGYAREVNRAKIAITCSSKYKFALMKYIEIPMSGTLLAADLPDERHEFFKKFMVVLDPKWSDGKIADKLEFYINHKTERKTLIKKGYKLVRNTRTHEQYADRFVRIVKNYLRGLGR